MGDGERNYDRLFAITVSKNYSTELSVILENNAKYFDKWYIATQEDDLKTIQLLKSTNLPNVEIIYYPLVPDSIEENHEKSPLFGEDLNFSYPSFLLNNGQISNELKSEIKLTFDKGAAIRSIQKFHILKENPTEKDIILLLDSDVLLPDNFKTELKYAEFNENTLYGARRKDFMFYSDLIENKNSKPFNQFGLAGFFQLYKYDSTKLCKRTHDAGWVDAEFKSQFKFEYVFENIVVSHLGCGGMNWKGKMAETFLHDDTESSLEMYVNEFGLNYDKNSNASENKNKLKAMISALQLKSLDYNRGFPDFIIPGFQNCGASLLEKNLVEHSNIKFGNGYMTDLNYCANQEYFASNYHRGCNWYWKHFQKDGTTWADCCEILFGRGWKASIEQMKTTYIKQLFDDLPPRKFIVVLRNPINRAFTEYNNFMKIFPSSYSYGWLKPGFSFLENIKAELLSINDVKTHLDWYNIDTDTEGRFILGGVYAPILKHFKDELELNEETLKIITLESLLSNSKKIFNEIFDFLGLDRQTINLRNNGSFSLNENIDKDSKQILSEFYKPFNEELFEFLGYEIKEWEV